MFLRSDWLKMKRLKMIQRWKMIAMLCLQGSKKLQVENVDLQMITLWNNLLSGKSDLVFISMNETVIPMPALLGFLLIVTYRSILNPLAKLIPLLAFVLTLSFTRQISQRSLPLSVFLTLVTYNLSEHSAASIHDFLREWIFITCACQQASFMHGGPRIQLVQRI